MSVFMGFGEGAYKKISAKTASYQVKETDLGTYFTTRGASGAITFTLPKTDDLEAGWWAHFHNVVDQNMVVASYGSSDDIVAVADAAADTITFSTTSQKIGANVRVVWDGTGWLSIFGSSATATIA